MKRREMKVARTSFRCRHAPALRAPPRRGPKVVSTCGTPPLKSPPPRCAPTTRTPKRNRRAGQQQQPVRYAQRPEFCERRPRPVDTVDVPQAGEAPTALEHLRIIGHRPSKPLARSFILHPPKPGDIDAIAHRQDVKRVPLGPVNPPLNLQIPAYPQDACRNQEQQRQHRQGVEQDVLEASHWSGIVSANDLA